jgi:hypothetical protein
MADPGEILSILEELVNAFPGKQMTRANFQVYIDHLSDIHPALLRRTVDSLIAKSTWFPRVSEIRSEVTRLVGSHLVSNWEPPLNYLRARYYELETEFFHFRKLDPDAWLDLADQFERRDFIYSAAGARNRLEIFQQILAEENHSSS